MSIDRRLVARIIYRLTHRLKGIERAKRKAQGPNGYVFKGIDHTQDLQDAIELIKSKTLTNVRRYNGPSTWDRWANGNQFGSYNSDED